jgi:hypothetical protein
MTKPTTPGPDSLAATLRAVAVVGASATAVAALVGGGRAMLGVGIGAAVALGNLWVVGRVVRGFFSGTAQAPWGFVAALKFALLVVGLWLLLRTGVVDLFPLVIGYGALPLGIFASQLGGASPARERG